MWRFSQHAIQHASGAGPAAEQPQTEEQRLKEQKRAAKALRRQQWEAQQADLVQKGADAGGAVEQLNGGADGDAAAEAAEPGTAAKKKSRKDVVCHFRDKSQYVDIQLSRCSATEAICNGMRSRVLHLRATAQRSCRHASEHV